MATMASSSSTRSALREIGERGHTMETRNSVSPFTVQLSNVPDSILTPSPDELVIRQRGRKKPSPMSAEMQCQEFLSIVQSPIKSPKKIGNLPTRSSPRKRLQLSDSPTPPQTPLSPSNGKPKGNSQLPKRQRIQRRICHPSDMSLAMKVLSQSQLIELIERLIENHPDLKEELTSMMPSPDLQPLEDRLVQLRRNVSSSFPRSRLVNRGDAVCYHRVVTHLSMFKKECLLQSRAMISSQQWSSVIDYVLLAWSYVDLLPNFECISHNKMKQQCFSTLASHCLLALKSGSLDSEQLEDISRRLKEAEHASSEMGPVLSYIEKVMLPASFKGKFEMDSEDNVS